MVNDHTNCCFWNSYHYNNIHIMALGPFEIQKFKKLADVSSEIQFFYYTDQKNAYNKITLQVGFDGVLQKLYFFLIWQKDCVMLLEF